MTVPRKNAQQPAIRQEQEPAGYMEAAAGARNRANVYGFLAAVLNERPDLAFVRNLRAADGAFILSLAKAAGVPEEVAQGFHDMAQYVQESKDRPESEIEQELAVEWTRLFRGVNPAFSPVPPYEASFTRTGKSEIESIQAVNQFYRENGLAINSDYSNRPDYIGLELSFLEHLAEDEAQAWEKGRAAQAESCAQVARAFIAEHLGAWAEMYIARAMDYADTGFYQGLLRLCRGVVTEAVV